MHNLRNLFLAVGVMASMFVTAQEKKEEEKGFQFTTIKDIPCTSVKDQYRSGTCWSFSGLGFLEAEMLRIGKPAVDLSEMFIVYHAYSDKAVKYVRLHGGLNFGAGGAFHDVTNVIKKYGVVPEEVYNGLNYGEEKHVHGELDRTLLDQVKVVVDNPNKKLTTAWHDALNSTLDSYLGKLPEKFKFEGKDYTPQSFAQEVIGLNMEDYVEISSYTHHPFYSKFIIEVPDNWSWDQVYNVPMNELNEIIDNAINTGYTVAWAADVSEKGFATSQKGVAVIPVVDKANMTDAEITKWEKQTEKERNEELYKLNKPGAEKVITQEMRQIDFDNYQTTDDHGMVIVGTAKDQNGNLYYKVKNSWGDYNDYDGYFYASKPYVSYKTMSIMVHKDAIPKNIRKKLNIL
ncbi:MAG: aminopeptidase [Prolixibacteraceae bacterium]|nr:aminopeptidase [Prolixibacteraceae bacterium]